MSEDVDGTDPRGSARTAKDHVKALVDGDPRVHGVGIARWNGRYAVTVNVSDETDRPRLPDLIAGVPVRVRRTGPIATLPGDPPQD